MELETLEKSKLTSADSPTLTDTMIDELLEQGENLTSDQLLTVLRRMTMTEFSQFKLLTEIEQLRKTNWHNGCSAEQEGHCDHYNTDIRALLHGDATEMGRLKKELAHEKDKVFAICTVGICAAIILWSAMTATSASF